MLDYLCLILLRNDDRHADAHVKRSEHLGIRYVPFFLNETEYRKDPDFHHADIVIALTPRDEDNLVICELCKKKFHVKKTVSLVSDPGKTEFFRQMGVDSVVCAIADPSMIFFLSQIPAMLEVST